MSAHHELPPDKHEMLKKAVRLEWISILYLLSAIVLLYFTLGSSQAMKAAWVEDILGLPPPIAFLVASRVRNREPNDKFPYGYHRATAIAYLCASVALLALGAFILYDSVSKLLRFEHPPIDLVKPFGDRPVWLGWLMLGALAYSAVPQVFLGRPQAAAGPGAQRQGAVRGRRDEPGRLDDRGRGHARGGRDRVRAVVGRLGGGQRSSRSTSSATATRT